MLVFLYKYLQSASTVMGFKGLACYFAGLRLRELGVVVDDIRCISNATVLVMGRSWLPELLADACMLNCTVIHKKIPARFVSETRITDPVIAHDRVRLVMFLAPKGFEDMTECDFILRRTISPQRPLITRMVVLGCLRRRDGDTHKSFAMRITTNIRHVVSTMASSTAMFIS